MPHPARFITIRRHSIAIGAMIVLSVAGAAAMWTGWLPSRAMQWNDLNGRLALGSAGAVVTQPDAPPVEHSWIGGAVSTAARADHLSSDALPPAYGNSTAAAAHEKQADRGNAQWSASSRAHLVGTAGRSGIGGGGAKGGGGLGAASGVASASQKSSSPAAPKAPKPAAANGSGGRSSGSGGGGGGGGSVTFAEQTTTVADLAAGTTPATTAMDLGFTEGANAAGDPGGMAPTPEPSSLLLIGTGVLGVAGVLRRRIR